MTIFNIEIIEIGFLIGASCFIWCWHLLYPGKVLDFVRGWINKATHPIKNKELKGKLRFAWYECESCLSGQVALIVGLIYFQNAIETALLFITSIIFASLLKGICVD